MALKFGTSGLRGLVTEMTPAQVARYTRAFLAGCAGPDTLYVGRDLRGASPRIAGDVMAAARQAGCRAIDAGAVPTPALALRAMGQGAAAVMVTGSHIPADRNGLKFYTATGEITKSAEQAILAAYEADPAGLAHEGGATGPAPVTDEAVGARYVARYIQAFGGRALQGRRIGLYSHSAVGRDLVADVLRQLGADVIELGRSEHFIPVDTEAVDAATRAQITQWVRSQALDALVSTDGDSDRPLLADEQGQIVPGDIMGQIAAQGLGADCVVTPVSSNSGVMQKGFERVVQTRIGSPFVIAAMQEVPGRVVGYEANGGFLLGFEAQGPAGVLPALMTRDAVLPLVAVLASVGDRPLSQRVAAEPPVFTAADRLQEVPQPRMQAFVKALAEETAARRAFLQTLGGQEAGCDLTDGVRMRLQDGCVVHVRPSGNAPELRLYTEAGSRAAADALLVAGLMALEQAL